MCKDPLATIRDLMKVQCKRTCGFCDQTEAPTTTTTTTTTKRPTKRTTKRPTTKRTTRPAPDDQTPHSTNSATHPPHDHPETANHCSRLPKQNAAKILAVKKRTLCARTCGYCRG
ncbi:hypothetical protein M3Y99_00734300 [Aphelenchoides fujianensis]|nr:hypothetical protein M3Y99_00734300 [Aphelenchoides fujianensis]